MWCGCPAAAMAGHYVNARWAAPSAGNQLYAAHCGDTRAVMSRNGEALRLTEDHKPNLPRERKRVEVRLCRLVVHCHFDLLLGCGQCTRLRAARSACCDRRSRAEVCCGLAPRFPCCRCLLAADVSRAWAAERLVALS